MKRMRPDSKRPHDGPGLARLGAALALAFAAAAMFMASCNYVGPAAYIINGPPSVDAQVHLADVPTVVYIDDRSNVVNPVSLRRTIADKVSQTLMTKKVLTTTISSQDAMLMTRQKERNGQLLPIEEIGKLVGAKQVIYITMVGFQDTPDGVTPRPMSSYRVKVIDVDQKQRIFPPADSAEDSRYGTATIREVDPGVYGSRSGRVKVFEMLASQTGVEVAKLFYKHEVKELGGNLNPPS